MTRLLRGFAPAIAFLCLLSACAGEPGPAAAGRVNESAPQVAAANGAQVGVASWYGGKFTGYKTSKLMIVANKSTVDIAVTFSGT